MDVEGDEEVVVEGFEERRRRRSKKAPFPRVAPLVAVSEWEEKEEDDGVEEVEGEIEGEVRRDGRGRVSGNRDEGVGEVGGIGREGVKYATPRALRRVRSSAFEFYSNARSQVGRAKSSLEEERQGKEERGKRRTGRRKREWRDGGGGGKDSVVMNVVGSSMSGQSENESVSGSSFRSREVSLRDGPMLEDFQENLEIPSRSNTDLENPSSPVRLARTLSRLTRGLSRQLKLGSSVISEPESGFGFDGDGSGGRGLVLYPQDAHTATVIFLHGWNDAAKTWAASLKSFGLRHVKYVLPTASHQISKATMGVPVRAWFSVGARNGDKILEADESDLQDSVRRIDELVQGEMDLGISAERILVGGFSQGAAVALSMLLASSHAVLGGVFALSGWLPVAQLDLENVGPSPTLAKTPVLLVSGSEDKIVPEASTKKSMRFLEQTGFEDVRLHCIPEVAHDVNDQILSLLNVFVAKRVPLNFDGKERLSMQTPRNRTYPVAQFEM